MPSPKSKNRPRTFKTSSKNSSEPLPAAELFCLPNQSTSEVFRANPWTSKAVLPASARKDKDALKSWSQKPTTKHLFFSTYEGTNPHLRISEQNPPIYLHGIVADYDAEISDAMLGEVKFDESHHWTATSKTFSGHRRCVWMFEKPLLLHSVQLTKRFLQRAAKELRLDALLPGLDQEALLHPAKYYEAGSEWKFGHDLIPTTAVNYWLQEASQKYDFGSEGPSVPIELVAAEVEKKYPGTWEGPFELGARGRRFWDPEADNPTAAIVRETGMQCFTGPKSFVTWAEILGIKFVKSFEEDRLGGAVEEIYFDGRDYWMGNPAGDFVSFTQERLARHLRVKRGLSGDRGRKETHSEVDRALVMIDDHGRIEGALPFVHQTPGLIWISKQRYLNTSRSRVLQPVAGKRKWGEGFPWMASFFDTFMNTREALECLLAWMQRFYVSALDQNMLAGQAIFIAGGVGQGKSLFTTVMLAELMGGFADASKYLLGESDFNKALFEVCLWCIDDSIPSSDPRKHMVYSAMMKKMVANRVFEYHAKFRDQMSVPWIGRVATTLNYDEESTRILPDMEINTLDKISLFRARDVPNRKFPKTPTKTIQEEAPSFARWLADWKAPAHTIGSARFGVRSYHDPEMLETARQSGDSAHFAELLEYFKDMYFHLNNDRSHWQGTATELYAWMTSDQDAGMRELARTYNTRSIGRNLAKLMAQGAPLRLVRTPGGGGRQWIIMKGASRAVKRKARLPKETDDIDDK